MRCEVLTAMTIDITSFCDMTSCRLWMLTDVSEECAECWEEHSYTISSVEQDGYTYTLKMNVLVY
jgi:hypothetical protein